MKPKLIFISGLGADESVFQNIQSFENYESVFVPWKAVIGKPSLESYTKELLKEINIQAEDVIVGLSFGGLIAIELARQNQLKKVILISSFRDKGDLKGIIKTSLNLKLYKLIPNFRIEAFSSIFQFFLTTRTKNGKDILNKMISKQDMQFTKWAIHQIDVATYEMDASIAVYNIIGGKDRLVKRWSNEHTFLIEEGGHLMVVERAHEVNHLLEQIL